MAKFEKLSPEEPASKPDEEPAGTLAPLSKEQPGVSGKPAEKEVVKLSEPSKELSARLLGRVKESAWGMMDHPFDGGVGQRIFSLEVAADFLRLSVARNDFTCYIEPNALKKWVGEVLGDTELAQAIGELIKEKEYNNCSLIDRLHAERELIIPFKELLLQRLEQCKEVAGEATGA